MKVLFMGTPDFAVETLSNLIENHEVVAVVTQPDRAKGRGKKVLYSPVKELALKHNIEVIQPEKIREASVVEKLKQFDADIFVVVAYGQILPESVLNIPKYKCVNVHGSILPKYRGAAPIQWSVLNGDKKTGVTIMYMDKGMDTGDIILIKETEIKTTDTTQTMYEKLAKIGADALIEALEQIEKGTVVALKQNDEEATHAPMLSKEMGKIDFTKTSEEIINKIRGMNPWPCAYTTLENEVYKIWRAEETNENKNNQNAGEILEVNNKIGITVATGNGAIIIKEIQKHGGKRLEVSEFLKGNKIEEKKVFV